MADDTPKSALELAMERLRRKDAEEGVEQRPLSDEDKAAIAEVRNFYEAKLAQLEVMHKSGISGVQDPAAAAEREAEYRREREHLNSERDAKIERIRRRT
jgi:hypothetical protein